MSALQYPKGFRGSSMASTLRDELASLKIERSETSRPTRPKAMVSSEYRRRGGGLRLLSWMLWLIPLSHRRRGRVRRLREYDRVRSKPEVTVGLVQMMTTGEAEKLLSAKGYLKSQQQAMIGTKVAGRVEEMRVQGARSGQERETVLADHRASRPAGHDRAAEGRPGADQGRTRGGQGRPVGEEIARRTGPIASSPRRWCLRKISRRLPRPRRCALLGSRRSRPRSR